MKKLIISRLFLYRYRFIIGYSILGLVFAGLIFLMPLVSPGGVSRAEMESAVAADALGVQSLLDGDVINLPFRALQKLSFTIFGLSMYSIKLPAIVIGLVTGVFLILLLNRWFKTNVAMITSGFVVMSSFFLANAGMGTPDIMAVFWLVMMIWAGAKLVGAEKNNFWLLLVFFASLALSCYCPLFIYLVLLVGLVSLFLPHLRFFLKTYSRGQTVIALTVFAVLVTPLVYGVIVNNETLRGVLLGGVSGNFWDNMEIAFAPFFSFTVANVWGVLAPMFGMATVVLTIIGIVASSGKLHTSKNVVTGALIVFSIVSAGLYPAMSMIVFLPILMLVANGIELVIYKWYALFPENPYARLFGIFPIALFSVIALVSGLTHFFYGYLYVPAVTDGFDADIVLVREHVPSGGILVVQGDELRLRFYKILEKREMVVVTDSVPDWTGTTIVTLGRLDGEPQMALTEIITSSKAMRSDRLYVYNQE